MLKYSSIDRRYFVSLGCMGFDLLLKDMTEICNNQQKQEIRFLKHLFQ